MITHKEVQEYFDYRTDGQLIWKKKKPKAHSINIGDVAGSVNKQGYKQIWFNGKGYQSHRLVWLWHHGSFPNNGIDHINRIRADNRIENLRDATQQTNLTNKSIYSNNNSSVTGVFKTKSSKWEAYITIKCNYIYLGRFTDKEDAITARRSAEIKYGFTNE